MKTYTLFAAVLVCLSACLPVALAQGKPKPPDPVYPEVDPSPWYEVDASWPRKPADFTWAAMPGVAVDKDDNVYLFTRSTPAVQVYAPDGTMLRSWGGGTGAHHIKIDREGNVWTSDYEHHIVQKHKQQ